MPSYSSHVFFLFSEDNLSLGQYSVQSSIWPCPPDCTRYSPNNAVDGNNKTCMRADIIGESSGEKTVWWRVNLGDIKSIYSIRIQFKNIWQQYIVRQRGRLAGFSLYIFNTTEIQSGHLCYKDGPELPLLDITNVCTNHGRYVIFYNERKIWEVYYPKDYETSVVTELCEVDVMGCHTEGFYGQNCDLACPLHCQKRRCHIINGTCLGCTAGWIGDFCNTACSFGYHGMECKTRCTGYCLRGSSCNHVSGLCEYGCESGWTAPSCDQQLEKEIDMENISNVSIKRQLVKMDGMDRIVHINAAIIVEIIHDVTRQVGNVKAVYLDTLGHFVVVCSL
ncbi:uncharacterized protein LOC134272047 [Saccostrea cucullata]|uniref:uncharacterized protein LOC134272047 n=1 Tax=Saccostrea cuccullata TaxID=36930 RepID=UPI002ED26BD2